MSRLLPLFCLLSLVACEPVEEPPAPVPPLGVYDLPVGPYEVDVRWTDYGIPHIEAEDYGSLGYGLAYAYARDGVCTLADQIVMARSERSKYFGAGEDDAHISRDIGWLALGVYDQAERGFLSMPQDVQQIMLGYAAGYNAYIEEVGPQGLPSLCRGAEWVKPITHVDLLAYYLTLGESGSGGVFVEAIANAAPPSFARDGGSKGPDVFARLAEHKELGSNGWAIGGERSAGGGGMLLANPHFPDRGNRRWFEAQLTIPGTVNVYGASLAGVAGINVGFNEDVAWTHTVSGTPRFTGYQLSLDPADPTRYLYDGGYRAMEPHDFVVDVLQGDGSYLPFSRTLYRSHYGWMIDAPSIGWGAVSGFAIRDANENNLDLVATWAAMNRAGSLDAFIDAQRSWQGIPWVHTLAASADGEVWFADSASAPNLSPAAEQAYPQWLQSSFVARLFADAGAYLLDGSDPVFEWIEADTRRPGLVPFDEAPQLRRDDFVANANDNHWLSNPSAPVTGFPMVYGAERTPRSPRTRMNLMYLMDLGDEQASGDDGKFSLDELEVAALSGRGSLAELLLPAVLARCQASPSVEIEGQPIDLGPACDALVAWDGKVGIDSAGFALWRELLGGGEFEDGDFFDDGALFAVGFDADDPVQTPNTLRPAPAAGQDPVLLGLGRALLTLEQAGIAPNARLGDVQFRYKDGAQIPVLGGTWLEGAIAIAGWSGGDDTLLERPQRAPIINSATDLTADGYAVNFGNSILLAVDFQADGPRARGILTYSQSQDPASAHFADQSELYATQSLRDVRFTEADIAANEIEAIHLSHPGSAN